MYNNLQITDIELKERCYNILSSINKLNLIYKNKISQIRYIINKIIMEVNQFNIVYYIEQLIRIRIDILNIDNNIMID